MSNHMIPVYASGIYVYNYYVGTADIDVPIVNPTLYSVLDNILDSILDISCTVSWIIY